MVLVQFPPRKIATNPKTNANPNSHRGAIFLGGDCLVAPPLPPSTLKLTLTLTQIPTINGEQFSSGDNCPDTQENIWILFVILTYLFTTFTFYVSIFLYLSVINFIPMIRVLVIETHSLGMCIWQKQIEKRTGIFYGLWKRKRPFWGDLFLA